MNLAKDRGLVRHIGVTGHHDPRILRQAVQIWPVDAVLMPVRELANAGRQQIFLTSAERTEILKPFIPVAKKLAFYRGTTGD